MRRILSIMTVAVLTFTAVCCGCSKQEEQSSKPASAATSDQAATADQPGTATGEKLGKVKVNDSTLGQIWIDELEGVPKNMLNASGFSTENGLKMYSENGKPASLEGIDVSSYSGDIDWTRVKQSGIDFVMVRIGGRGYGEEGKLYQDDRAVEYIKGAQAAGIKAGGYFFSQSVTTGEAKEEADYVRQVLGDIKPDFPIAYDWELIKEDEARTDKVTAEQATENAAAFCRQAVSYGYTPMIYSTSRELYFKYDLSKLAEYGIWYSEYSDTPAFYYQFSMWQYSKEGVVDGVEGKVDLDICFTGIADYAK